MGGLRERLGELIKASMAAAFSVGSRSGDTSNDRRAAQLAADIAGDYDPEMKELTPDNTPDSHTEVWVCSGGKVFIGTLWVSQGWKNRDGYSIVTPTHWAPIRKPAPPEVA